MRTTIDYSRLCTDGTIIYMHAPKEVDTFFADWHLIPQEIVLNRLSETKKIDSFTMAGPPFYYMYLQICLLKGVLANTRLQISVAAKLSLTSLYSLSDAILRPLEKNLGFKKMGPNSRQDVNDFLTLRLKNHLYWFNTLAPGSVKKMDYDLAHTF